MKEVSTAFLLAMLVAWFTIIGDQHGITMRIENGLFDLVEEQISIDSKSDWNYSRHQDRMEDLLLINLDTSFINTETDRVKKSSLITLIKKLTPKMKGRVMYLDYLIDHAIRSDESFMKSLLAIKDHLVLPFAMRNNSTRLDQALVPKSEDLINKECKGLIFSGHINFEGLYHKDHIRYIRHKVQGGTILSSPLAIVKRLSGTDFSLIHQDIPEGPLEINYLLRNRESIGQEKAVMVYEAFEILALPGQDLAELLNGKKVIFIGKFRPEYDKYEQFYDCYLTPIDPELPGTYLIVNSFLNLRKKP